MCEILLHVHDAGVNPDPQIEAGRFKPGDVVYIQEDGVPWGALDIGPHSKLIKLPGIPVSSVVNLMGGESLPATDPATGLPAVPMTHYPRLRVLHFPNIAALTNGQVIHVAPAAILAWVNANTAQRATIAVS